MHTRQNAANRLLWVWRCARYAVPFAVAGVCIALVIRSLDPGVFKGFGAAITAIAPWQWIGAIASTCVSFWAVARYDLVLHRHFDTGVPARDASLTGAAAIAIGQTIGMGVISSAFVRWRMLPGLDLATASKISAAVAVTFLIGLLFAIGVTGLLGETSTPQKLVSCIFLLLFFISVLLLFFKVEISIFGNRFCLPSVPAMLTIGGLTFVDTVFAGLALWILLPTGSEISVVALLPVFVFALGASIVSGSPGGVGPFELTLLGLTPGVSQTDLLVAIVAYRLVYYVVPAILAAILLVRPFARHQKDENRLAPVHATSLAGRTHAETGLLHQDGARILKARKAAIGVIQTGHSLCALFRPLNGSLAECLKVLHHTAHQQNRVAMLYKANASAAKQARSMGWAVISVADDMALNPSEFSTEGPEFRQLRRKLRQAEKAGLRIAHSSNPPWPDMTDLDAAWQQTHGRARRLTMGQLNPQYMAHQRIILAYQAQQLVGFASFHESPTELCLDLMRTTCDAPNGTMHSLIMAAIEQARADSLQRLSLAALPPQKGLVAWLARKHRGDGLCQFKTCFAPRRVRLYAAAPSLPELLFALADLWWSMRRPNTKNIQVFDEDYEFDYIKSA